MTAGPERRPFVTLSWAQSIDGSIALRRGERQRISGAASLAATHRLRAEHDAILVGVGTVLADDPRLDVRLAPGPSPRPVVLDTALRTPPHCALAGRVEAKPLLFTAAPADGPRRAALEARGCRVIEVDRDDEGRLSLAAVLADLAARGVTSVLVEGGGAVIASFLQAGCVDRIVVTIAPTFLAGFNPFAEGERRWSRFGISRPRIEILEADIVIDGVPEGLRFPA